MMNVLDAAEHVLKEAGKPLHARDIAKRMIETGLWSTIAKNQKKVLVSYICQDMKKWGDKSRFIRVAPNTFNLRDV